MSNSSIIISSPSQIINKYQTELVLTNALSISNSGWTDVTDGTTTLQQTLTPASSSSRFLIFIMLNGYVSQGSAVRLVTGGSTPVAFNGVVAGSRTAAMSPIKSGSVSGMPGGVSIALVDAPATSSSITYKVQIIGSTTATYNVNKSSTDTNSASFMRSTSRIIILELSS